MYVHYIDHKVEMAGFTLNGKEYHQHFQYDYQNKVPFVMIEGERHNLK